MARPTTIAEHMRDVLVENDCGGVVWGDCWLLDECASRCTHTTLMDAHPLDRHKRILDALCRSTTLFEKWFIRFDGFRGPPLRRFMKLVDGGDDDPV